MKKFYCYGKKDFCDDRICVDCNFFNGDGGEEIEVDTLGTKAETRFVYIPCKIGDTVWAIRNFSGTKKVVSGKVSEMCFMEDMSLCIVVKNVIRGQWGKNIFATEEDATRAL